MDPACSPSLRMRQVSHAGYARMGIAGVVESVVTAPRQQPWEGQRACTPCKASEVVSAGTPRSPSHAA